MVDRHALSCPCSCHGRGTYAECDPAYPAGCGHLHDHQNGAQNGRRAPNGGCPGCGARVADNALCGACTTRFSGDLEAVPYLAAELETLRAKLDRLGERSTGAGSAEIPLGFRPAAVEVADVLHVTLAVWARHVAQAQGLPLYDVPAEHPARLAAWLYGWREAVRHLVAVGQLTDEIGYAVRTARRTIDRPADRIYLGPCDDCEEDLYTGLKAEQVVCECGRPYRVEDRRAWLLRGLREHLATASEIAAGIGDLYGQPINRGTIHQWHHRNRLHEHGTTREGWPLFKVGDVLNLASKQVAGPTRRASN